MAGRTGGSAPAAAPAAAPLSGPIIGGSLNFGGGGGGMFTGGVDGLAASYQSAYNAALASNQQNYNNILGGYQQLASNQYANQQNIAQGYSNLNNDVLNRLAGSNSANIQSINDQYQAQLGKTAQQLTSSGLNNTTIVSALNRGINLDQAKATTQSNNDFAKLIASYQSNLGLAGLDYLNQANQQQTGLGEKQLNWMNSVDVAYPDASAYSQLAMMYGQMDQADKNRDQMDKYMRTQTPTPHGGGSSGVYGATGSVGGPQPYYGTNSTANTGGWGMGTSPGAVSKSATSYSGDPFAGYYASLGGGMSDDGYEYLATDLSSTYY